MGLSCSTATLLLLLLILILINASVTGSQCVYIFGVHLAVWAGKDWLYDGCCGHLPRTVQIHSDKAMPASFADEQTFSLSLSAALPKDKTVFSFHHRCIYFQKCTSRDRVSFGWILGCAILRSSPDFADSALRYKLRLQNPLTDSLLSLYISGEPISVCVKKGGVDSCKGHVAYYCRNDWFLSHHLSLFKRSRSSGPMTLRALGSAPDSPEH